MCGEGATHQKLSRLQRWRGREDVQKRGGPEKLDDLLVGSLSFGGCGGLEGPDFGEKLGDKEEDRVEWETARSGGRGRIESVHQHRNTRTDLDEGETYPFCQLVTHSCVGTNPPLPSPPTLNFSSSSLRAPSSSSCATSAGGCPSIETFLSLIFPLAFSLIPFVVGAEADVGGLVARGSSASPGVVNGAATALGSPSPSSPSSVVEARFVVDGGVGDEYSRDRSSV